jgi:hypothetical protein
MKKRKNFDRDNVMAAAVIARDPRAGGLALEWARLWMARQGAQRKKADGKPELLPSAVGRRCA